MRIGNSIDGVLQRTDTEQPTHNSNEIETLWSYVECFMYVFFLCIAETICTLYRLKSIKQTLISVHYILVGVYIPLPYGRNDVRSGLIHKSNWK